MRIGEYNKEKKKESYFHVYFLAGMLGFALFFFLLLSTKVIIFTLKFVFDNWIWVTVGVLILLILIKKLKKPKVIKEVNRYEDQYR